MILTHRQGRKMSTDAEDIIALCLFSRYIYCPLACRQTASKLVIHLWPSLFGTGPPDFDLCELMLHALSRWPLQLQLECKRPAQNSRLFTARGDLHKTKQCDHYLLIGQPCFGKDSVKIKEWSFIGEREFSHMTYLWIYTLEKIYILEVIFFSWFGIGISFEGSGLF